MKFINNIVTVVIIVALTTFMSCSTDDDVDPTSGLENLKLLSEDQITGTDLTLKIYQYTQDLSVGYNKFEILINKAGFEDAFTNAEITFKPMMDMGTMMHACPTENPVVGANIQNVFAGAVVFVMPSSEMGSWSLGVKVKDKESDEEGEVMIPVIIKMPDEARMKSFSLGDDKFFVSMVEPFSPQVGINDFEVTVHKKQSMMDWPPVAGFNVTIEPEMPDMGHGSPNNVDPVHSTIGHYNGKVNFTMDGYWKINMVLELDGQAQELSFDVTFEHKSAQ